MLSFRQSHEFSSWVERIDLDFETMLRLAAQMQEWDKNKFIAAAQQDYRLGAEKVAEFDENIYLAMKGLAAGIAREIVDTSKTAGEAWYRLTDRFYGRNVQGATALAGHLPRLQQSVFFRVVPETYLRAMESQVDVDKVEPYHLEDKVLAFMRNNTSGAAPTENWKH